MLNRYPARSTAFTHDGKVSSAPGLLDIFTSPDNEIGQESRVIQRSLLRISNLTIKFGKNWTFSMVDTRTQFIRISRASQVNYHTNHELVSSRFVIKAID